jgi:hypothetical protein
LVYSLKIRAEQRIAATEEVKRVGLHEAGHPRDQRQYNASHQCDKDEAEDAQTATHKHITDDPTVPQPKPKPCAETSKRDKRNQQAQHKDDPVGDAHTKTQDEVHQSIKRYGTGLSTQQPQNAACGLADRCAFQRHGWQTEVVQNPIGREDEKHRDEAHENQPEHLL